MQNTKSRDTEKSPDVKGAPYDCPAPERRKAAAGNRYYFLRFEKNRLFELK
jgi:hypothetical protein